MSKGVTGKFSQNPPLKIKRGKGSYQGENPYAKEGS